MNYYDRKEISNSNLSLLNPLEGGSPKKFKTYVLDKEKRDDDTPTLKNGKLIHKYIENKNAFIISDIVKPSEMMASWVETYFEQKNLMFSALSPYEETQLILSTKGNRYSNMKDEDKIVAKFHSEGTEYLKFLEEANGKIIMDNATGIVVNGVIDSLKKSKECYNLLFALELGDDVESELDISWSFFTESGKEISCKSLLDKVKINETTQTVKIIDGKTTSKPISLFHESIVKYRYFRQLAFYREAMKDYLKHNYPKVLTWKFEFYFVVMETTGLFEVAVRSLPDEWIERGYEELKSLLERYQSHLDQDNWETQLEFIKTTAIPYEKI